MLLAKILPQIFLPLNIIMQSIFGGKRFSAVTFVTGTLSDIVASVEGFFCCQLDIIASPNPLHLRTVGIQHSSSVLQGFSKLFSYFRALATVLTPVYFFHSPEQQFNFLAHFKTPSHIHVLSRETESS